MVQLKHNRGSFVKTMCVRAVRSPWRWNLLKIALVYCNFHVEGNFLEISRAMLYYRKLKDVNVSLVYIKISYFVSFDVSIYNLRI